MSWTRSKLFIPISLTLITLGALVIRLAGVNFGLPQAYHVDEHFYYPAAWSMGQGQLDLPNQSHGPSLYLFTLLIGQWIIKAISFPQLSPVDFGRLIDTNPWPFMISARAVSVLAGALTIPCVFWLGRCYRDQRIGLAAAALMAILFFYVRDSHFGVPDSFMTLFVTAAAWLALRSYQTQARRDFILAGLMAGIATAAKYTSAFIFIPVILAAFRFLPNTGRVFRSLLPALSGFIIGFIIGYPNIVINLPAFIKDISFLWVRVGSGYEGWSIMPDNSPLYYLNTLMWGIGLPMLVLSAVGIGVAIASRKMSEWIVIVFPTIYFVVLSLSRGHFGRYMLPILPMLCVITADICLRSLPNLWAWITRQVTAQPGHLAGLIGTFIFAGVLITNLAQSIRFDWLLSQADTRTLAKDWIEVNIPAGARVAVEWPFHTPPLSNGYEVPPQSKQDYWIDLVWGFGLADRPLEQYQTDGTQYIISTSYIAKIPVADPAQETTRQKFYAALPAAFKEIKTFSPQCDGGEPDFVFDQIYGPAVGLWQTCFAGPFIRIYQVPK